jgi:hypothetical protein
MSARANARFIGLMLAIGSASTASAGDQVQPAGSTPEVTSGLTLPIFLDAARLPALQAAWRSRFGDGGIAVAAPIVAKSSDPEAGIIVEARQTLTRAEQVTNEATAVRERAEALSRRFAISADDVGSAPVPDPDPASAASPAAVTETASTTIEAAPSEAASESPAQVQQVSATVDNSGDMAPASMLGGPAVGEAPDSGAAPVIEDMAKPVQQAKRIPLDVPERRVVQTAPQSRGFFASIFSGSGDDSAPKPDDPEKNSPLELRSFGWNAQP